MYTTLNGTTDEIDKIIGECDYILEHLDSNVVDVTGKSLNTLLEKVRSAKKKMEDAREKLTSYASSMKTIQHNVENGNL